MQGHELTGIVPSCDRSPRYQTRSARRLAPQPVRYQSASASGEGR